MTSQTINRLTAGLATAVFLALSLLLANLSTPQRSDTMLRRTSTFFTDPSGARALFLVVQQFSPGAEQWRRSLQFLPEPREAGTLFIAGPQIPLTEREAEQLEGWLGRGGQLILLSSHGWPIRSRSSPEKIDPKKSDPTLLQRWEPALAWTKPENEMRTGLAEGISADGITLGWRAGFRDTGRARVIASAGTVPLAIEIPIGKGRILAVADPTMASNGALRRSDNGVWLASLILGGSGGRVLFDEYHHGFGQKRGTAELTRAFLQTPWGWCVLQLLLAGLLYAFFYRRRFGRIREPLTVERSSPLELIQARAGVFRSARAQRLAADLIVQQLCHDLGKPRGRLVDAARLEQELDQILRRSGAPSDYGLAQLFAKIRTNPQLADREFIELGAAAGEIIKGSKS